jgi:hypothetical protein
MQLKVLTTNAIKDGSAAAAPAAAQGKLDIAQRQAQNTTRLSKSRKIKTN